MTRPAQSAPAPTKRKPRKSKLDPRLTLVPGFEATKPPVISNSRLRGVWLRLAASDDAILEQGLVKTSAELPKHLFQSKRDSDDGRRFVRRKDGRCNVKTCGIVSAKLDLGFQDFMHGLLADRQLSLVANEKGRSE